MDQDAAQEAQLTIPIRIWGGPKVVGFHVGFQFGIGYGSSQVSGLRAIWDPAKCPRSDPKHQKPAFSQYLRQPSICVDLFTVYALSWPSRLPNSEF